MVPYASSSEGAIQQEEAKRLAKSLDVSVASSLRRLCPRLLMEAIHLLPEDPKVAKAF
jgi:hypothetical protein